MRPYAGTIYQLVSGEKTPNRGSSGGNTSVSFLVLEQKGIVTLPREIATLTVKPIHPESYDVLETPFELNGSVAVLPKSVEKWEGKYLWGSLQAISHFDTNQQLYEILALRHPRCEDYLKELSAIRKQFTAINISDERYAEFEKKWSEVRKPLLLDDLVIETVSNNFRQVLRIYPHLKN